mgnify:CR=1 FL=1
MKSLHWHRVITEINNMKVKLEYVWLDGYKPEPNLRSKVKIIEVNSKEDLENIDELQVKESAQVFTESIK